jgi:CubicO group peptidase (beta-lactamase class C family)
MSMSTGAPIQGTCDARFASVREVFAEQLAKPEEIGAALSVTLDGQIVVDLWGGHADAGRARAWTPDTLVNVFSTTKGMTALCAHRLADQGKLDFDAPVARYWPEFAQSGKQAIPVRWLLDHSAGLAAVEKPLPAGAMCDWDAMTAALAEQAPLWEPGTAHGYHALTFGWLVGEVVRRVAGKSLGCYFRDEIAGPLGADFWIGTRAALDARTAELVPGPLPGPGEANLLLELMAQAKPWALKSFLNPAPPAGGMNGRAWRAAEIPAGNGHASARGLARVYTALACGGTLDGVGVLSPAQIDAARTSRRHGADLLIPLTTHFAQGFQLGTKAEPIGPSGRSFGHSGAGGSFGFADPESRLGFGYVMNRMENGLFLIGPRATALMNAAFASL